jgi:predicted CXXCH cytochrome family protein
MRALIRFVRRGQAGAVEHKERLFDGEAVTLGRSTDQVLHLKDRRVALKHARIALRGASPVISSKAPGGIVVNDALCREAALRPGDVIRIGANVLTVFAAPQGVDLAFSFELDPEAAAGDASLEPQLLDLGAIGWRRRSWSWLLFGVVTLLVLLVPAAGLMDAGTRDRIRSGPLPDDSLWLSGPLASAHHSTSEHCETCHQKPFQRVRNDACLGCHADVSRHFAASTGIVTELESARCAGCHAEHNEPESLLRRDDALCASCHTDIAGLAGTEKTTTLNASDFHDDHPQFRISLLTPPATVEERRASTWPVLRVAVDRPGLAERSRLKYPHTTHQDPAGIDGPDGKQVLDCGDCHRPQADGRRMQPVTMEEHCASCHRLDFDPAFPDATVPHGPASIVLQRLIEYYSRSYLELYPDPKATAVPARRVTVPGRPPDARERARLLQLARERAFAVARDLIERRTCQDCHEIQATGNAEDPWRVLPARLTSEWMPAARFSHERHATTLSSCEKCHDAEHSKKSADVLMPSISVCRECHGSGDRGHSDAALVQSGCTMCHGFHDMAQGPWAPAAPR